MSNASGTVVSTRSPSCTRVTPAARCAAVSGRGADPTVGEVVDEVGGREGPGVGSDLWRPAESPGPALIPGYRSTVAVPHGFGGGTSAGGT